MEKTIEERYPTEGSVLMELGATYEECVKRNKYRRQGAIEQYELMKVEHERVSGQSYGIMKEYQKLQMVNMAKDKVLAEAREALGNVWSAVYVDKDTKWVDSVRAAIASIDLSLKQK